MLLMQVGVVSIDKPGLEVGASDNAGGMIRCCVLDQLCEGETASFLAIIIVKPVNLQIFLACCITVAYTWYDQFLIWTPFKQKKEIHTILRYLVSN